MREITDYNWIGIRLCSKFEMTRYVNKYSYKESLKHIRQWSKEKFCQIKDVGFSSQILMPNQNIGSGTVDIEVKQKSEVATKAELTRAFKKHMGSKMTNKTILNTFIDQIA